MERSWKTWSGAVPSTHIYVRWAIFFSCSIQPYIFHGIFFCFCRVDVIGGDGYIPRFVPLCHRLAGFQSRDVREELSGLSSFSMLGTGGTNWWLLDYLRRQRWLLLFQCVMCIKRSSHGFRSSSVSKVWGLSLHMIGGWCSDDCHWRHWVLTYQIRQSSRSS
jgi:hypothetical protein